MERKASVEVGRDSVASAVVAHHGFLLPRRGRRDEDLRDQLARHLELRRHRLESRLRVVVDEAAEVLVAEGLVPTRVQDVRVPGLVDHDRGREGSVLLLLRELGDDVLDVAGRGLVRFLGAHAARVDEVVLDGTHVVVFGDLPDHTGEQALTQHAVVADRTHPDLARRHGVPAAHAHADHRIARVVPSEVLGVGDCHSGRTHGASPRLRKRVGLLSRYLA